MLIKKIITANLCLGLLVGCGAQEMDHRSSGAKYNTSISEADLEGIFASGKHSQQLDESTKTDLRTTIHNGWLLVATM